MSATDAQALLDATRLFLRRHEEALASGEPTLGLAACDGLIEALTDTLPRETAAVGATRADDVLARRISELEGLAMQLKLAFHQLEQRQVDVLRFVALLTATRRQLRSLQEVLALWAAEHGAPPLPDAPPFDAMRAAREALIAGVPDAAIAAIAAAARRAGVLEPAPARDLVDAWIALDETEAAIERARMAPPT